MSDLKTLHIERTFEAPAEAVFQAFTNEEVLRRWWHAGHDWETTEAEDDPRLGGAVRVAMRDPHKDLEYGGCGVYSEVEPPARLAFTWIWDDEPRGTLIEVDFEESDGLTTVRFTHRSRRHPRRARSQRRSLRWQTPARPMEVAADSSLKEATPARPVCHKEVPLTKRDESRCRRVVSVTCGGG